jgi:acetylornithine aminotransferase
LNEIDLVEAELIKEMLPVIIEPIQGVGGLDQGTTEFFQALEKACKANDVVLILMKYNLVLGEAGSFAHQYHDIKPDIICMAKVWVTVFQLVVF